MMHGGKYQILLTPSGATPIRDRDGLEIRICGKEYQARFIGLGDKILYYENGKSVLNYAATCLAGERGVSVHGYALLCGWDSVGKKTVSMEKQVAQALCDGINMMCR